MNCSCKNPHLRRRPEGLRDCNPTDVDSEFGEVSKELLALCIIAYHTHWDRRCAQRPKIVDRIGASSGNDLSFTVIENEDGRFARNSGNFAVDKHVSDEIANHYDALGIESIDNVAKPVHANSPETTDSTAVSKLSATKGGC